MKKIIKKLTPLRTIFFLGVLCSIVALFSPGLDNGWEIVVALLINMFFSAPVLLLDILIISLTKKGSKLQIALQIFFSLLSLSTIAYLILKK